MVVTALFYAVPVVLAFYGIRRYKQRQWTVCTNDVRMDEKVVIITGANSGIGFETAKELAKRGAEVIFACRNETLTLKAIAKIQAEIKFPAKLEFIELDLASIESIRTFARNVKRKYDRLDVLINNAGVSYPGTKRTLTKDNFEIHFGVNYLGHFLLTNLLLDRVQKAEHGRVVNVSSLLHQKGVLNLDDLNYETTTTKNAYANSKLQMMYFARELARRTSDTNVGVYTLCPGWVFTNLFRHSVRNIFKIFLAIPVALVFMRGTKTGAQTSIYCATEPSLAKESGLFYRDCAKFHSSHIFDDTTGQKLWELSAKLLNLETND